MALDIGIIVTAVNNARNSLRAAHADVDKLGVKGQAAANKLRAIHVVLAGIATGGLFAFGKKIVETTGDLEALIFRLGVLEGGLFAAKERFAELTRTFGNVPIALDAIVDGFVRLRSAGLASTEAMLTMKSAVDAVAAFGGGTEELKRLSIGLQQVLGKGVLQMEEMRQQIGEAVPSAMRILAREMGISVAELVNKIGKGMVDAQTAVTKLRIGFEKDFGGIAQAMGSTTIKGALAQFTTNIKTAVAQAFIFDTTANVRAASLIRDIGEAIARLIRSIDERKVAAFYDFLKNVANIAYTVVQGLAPIADVIAKIAGAIASLLASVPANIIESGVIAAVLIGVSKGNPLVALIGLLALVVGQIEGLGKVAGALVTKLDPATIGMMGLFGYMLLGAAGPGALLASLVLVIANVTKIIDLAIVATTMMRGLTEGNLFDPSELFVMLRDIRSGKIADKYVKGIVEHEKTPGSVKSAIKMALTTEELFGNSAERDKLIKERTAKDFEVAKKAYEDAMNRAKTGATPDGLGITGTKALEEFETLQRRLQIAMQEGAGRKVVAKLLQDAEQIDKKLAGARTRMTELEAARGTRNWTEEQATELKSLTDSFKFHDRAMEDFRRNAKNVRGAAVSEVIEGIDIAFRKAAASARVLVEEFRGSELSKTIADIDKKFTGVRESLEGVALRYKKVGDTEGLTRVRSMLAEINAVNKEAIAIAEKRYAIEQRAFTLDQQRSVLQIQSQVVQMQRELRSGLERGFTSAFADQAEDKRAQLRQQLLDTQLKIGELENKLLDPKLSEASRAALQNHKEALGGLLLQTQENINATTAYALATQSLWDSVASSIGSSMKEALKGFIKGTKNAEQVLMSFYDKITDAAIDYLFELGKIALKQAAMAAFGGATGGLNWGSLFGAAASGVAGGGGFANGGAFRGNIKAFANGGVIGGPTLFGLAGEAGKEGILPLDQVGGKLGVNASGLGGDYIEAHFHGVVDAASFFAQNRDNIIGTISAARAINRNRRV